MLLREVVYDVGIGGIDWNVTSEGGTTCYNHVSHFHRILETLFGLFIGCVSFTYGYKTHKCPSISFPSKTKSLQFTNRTLTLLFSFVFALQISFKIRSGTAIFLCYPCHLISVTQLILLTCSPSKTKYYVFQFMVRYLHGPLLAILFPVTNTLKLPFEVSTYWLQHILLLCLPLHLMRHIYSVSRDASLSWMAYGLWNALHWIILQGLSLLSTANIGSMLCSASSDPLSGPYYRLFGIAHQGVFIHLSGQFFAYLSSWMSSDYKKNLIKINQE